MSKIDETVSYAQAAEFLAQAMRRVEALAQAMEYYAVKCRENATDSGDTRYVLGKAAALETCAESLRDTLNGDTPKLLTPAMAFLYE